ATDPPYGAGEEFREWWQAGIDPPEFRRYSSREIALAREQHFALEPGAVEPVEIETEVDGQFTLAEAVEIGLIGYFTGSRRLNIE
ncbi:MAG TPA: hypothetical protein VN863_02575, partial [Candidatus Dormibacteraeota bacterium]|nr:hypothetical protein [Candidatus Dormibacteraeota bacterium]